DLRGARGRPAVLPLPPSTVTRLERYLLQGRPHLVSVGAGDPGQLILTERGGPLVAGEILRVVTATSGPPGSSRLQHGRRGQACHHGLGVVSGELARRRSRRTTSCVSSPGRGVQVVAPLAVRPRGARRSPG